MNIYNLDVNLNFKKMRLPLIFFFSNENYFSFWSHLLNFRINFVTMAKNAKVIPLQWKRNLKLVELTF